MRIIGITGPAGCGKDTAGAAIVAVTSCSYQLAFAEPIKAALSAMFGDDFEGLSRDRKEQPGFLFDLSPRKLMQLLGTEWGRKQVHVDLWVELMRNRIIELEQRHLTTEPVFVITDVRFENEAAFIRDNGGLMIRIERGVKPVAKHVSEAGVGLCGDDVQIWNTGSVGELRAKAVAAAGRFAVDKGLTELFIESEAWQ